ncbi:MAG TPA: hypothetical protein PK299_14080 [Anaerolineales bacterium]|nr:hypothetical protein [Anaerolineales bacterium]
MKKNILQSVCFLSILLTMLLVGDTWAHGRTAVGEYQVVIGWRAEPPLVGERNAILFEITHNEEAVTGLEGTLDMEVTYGGKKFIGDLKPTSQEGWYETDVVPTVKGQYEVRLVGKIEDTAVDVVLLPEEVQGGAVLQFPEILPETREQAKTIANLQAQVAILQWLAIGGLVLGLAGTALAVLSWRKKG